MGLGPIHRIDFAASNDAYVLLVVLVVAAVLVVVKHSTPWNLAQKEIALT